MTQTDLALAAESSTRHLSCLETGKAQPSRDMVIRLAEYLNVPLRDRNTLLLAAGFAPAFGERPLDGLEAAKAAIESVLRAPCTASGVRGRPALELRAQQTRSGEGPLTHPSSLTLRGALSPMGRGRSHDYRDPLRVGKDFVTQ